MTALVQSSRAIVSRRDVLRGAGVAIASTALTAFAGPLPAPADALVSTPDGKLRGELLPDGLRVFRGIPFAEPPVGPLRFRPPVSVRPWTGVRDALRFASEAMQPDDHGIPRSEDCLYLNVWCPTSPGPHPVFVWIHGGGYTGGNSFAPIFDGSPFAREGIVTVTVAYRLGAFGFLDLGPLLGPEFNGSANNGMRDLVESLRWVQRNIASFGGDPTRVTVGGESAGAKATAALMGLPEAQPLFHSAISESGGGERVLTRDQAAEVAHRFADQWLEHTGEASKDRPAPTRNDEGTGSSSVRVQSLAGLRTADPVTLIAAQERTIRTSPLHFPFRSEIDGTYLRARPADLVAQGSARDKRLLLGTNRDESALFLGAHPTADPTAADLGNLPLSRFTSVLAQYAVLYPAMSPAQRRIRAVTAEEYWVPSIRLADAHVRAGGTAWMYRLDFSGNTGRYAGESYHTLDLGLVWRVLDPEASPEYRALAQTVHQAWCTFIRGEDPAAPGLPPWTAYNAATRPTMLVDTASRIENRPAEAELRLWAGVL